MDTCALFLSAILINSDAHKEARMRRHLTHNALILTAFALGLLISSAIKAQDSNSIYGDFKVDDSKVQGQKPQTFQVILYSLSSRVFDRQVVSNNSRYRFLRVPNGEWDLVVEVEGVEVTRVRLVLQSPIPTDVRHDLNLEWHETIPAKKAVGTIAALPDYKRSPAMDEKYKKAMEAMKNKNDGQAEQILREIVDSDARDFIAWTDLGTLQFKHEKYSDAEKSYQHALAERGDFLVALMNLGKLQMTQKNYDPAIETLTRAVTSNPQSADANHYLGECYLQVKKGSKAVGFLNEAIRLDPVGKADLHLRLATLYHGAGLKDRAALEYEKFLQKKPDYPDKKKLLQYIAENKK
jgi:Tfp pilus assembly protein PilF